MTLLGHLLLFAKFFDLNRRLHSFPPPPITRYTTCSGKWIQALQQLLKRTQIFFTHLRRRVLPCVRHQRSPALVLPLRVGHFAEDLKGYFEFLLFVFYNVWRMHVSAYQVHRSRVLGRVRRANKLFRPSMPRKFKCSKKGRAGNETKVTRREEIETASHETRRDTRRLETRFRDETKKFA